MRKPPSGAGMQASLMLALIALMACAAAPVRSDAAAAVQDPKAQVKPAAEGQAAPQARPTALVDVADAGTPAPRPKVAEPRPADLKPAAAEPKKVAPPMDAEVKALVDKVQAFYEKTQDFVAEFRQDYTYKAFKRTQTSSGKVTYRRAATMRWEYEKPSPRTFVLAGDKVYALDPEAMTLTKASIATNKLSASVTFLWGQGKLAEEFAITRKDCASCKGTLLNLEPLLADPRFQRVRLEVEPKTGEVLKSTVVDPDGSENAIAFLKVQTNVGVDEKAFKIVPPPGTQVIDMTQMGAPAPTPKQ